jgi:hypothetical protein
MPKITFQGNVVISDICVEPTAAQVHRALRTDPSSATSRWRLDALRLLSLVVGIALSAPALAGCATVPPSPQVLGSVDVVDATGQATTLAGLLGRVVVVDVCVSSVAACPLNARALDLALRELQSEPVSMVTVLVEDVDLTALATYARVFEVAHPVVRAGPRTREGKSLLGDVMGVPRIVIFDRRGRVFVDESGGVLHPQGIIARARAALAR